MSVSRETRDKLETFVGLLIEENERQNLISKGSIPTIWSRHIEDSLQLLDHAPREVSWLDIGSGAGLPGLVLAIAGVQAITLVEPRRLRTEFLERCRDHFALNGVDIITGKVERVVGTYDVITARAVASTDRLFALGERLMSPSGQWVLPKGRSAEKELAEARATWQGEFRLVSSRTDPDARILLARGVRRGARRG